MLLWPAGNWGKLTTVKLIFKKIMFTALPHTTVAVRTSESRSTTDQPVEFGGYTCQGTESSLSECTVHSGYFNYPWARHGYAELKCISSKLTSK